MDEDDIKQRLMQALLDDDLQGFINHLARTTPRPEVAGRKRSFTKTIRVRRIPLPALKPQQRRRLKPE